MNIFKKYNLKNILLTVLWIAVGSGTLVLLAAAVHTRDKKLCKGLEIDIRGVNNNFFIDSADVRKIICSYTGDNLMGIETNKFNLVSMEAELKRDVWIKNAELYFDNNDVLQATIEEREPVARVFTSGDNSFYIDNADMMLPVSEKMSAKLPVFTSFPSDNKVLSKADSSLVNDIKTLSIQIQKDPFLMAMIDQVDITAQRNFEMIPKIGDQVIVFGDASDATEKFRKLELFYKKVMMKYGWSRYSIINLQYKGQVVGKLKGKDDVSADSLRTTQIIHEIAIEEARAINDSLQTFMQDNEKNTTNISIIEQSIQRDAEGEEITNPYQKYPLGIEPVKIIDKPVTKTKSTVVKKPGIKNNKPASKPLVKPPAKSIVTKPVQIKLPEKPKTATAKKNEY